MGEGMTVVEEMDAGPSNRGAVLAPPPAADSSLRSRGAVLLISCYELGHQPLATALPLGFLERAGFAPDAVDIAVERLDEEKVQRARVVGISVPMHTALRLGVRVAERVRALNPSASICFYGLYAALNADYLLEHGADFCIGGEFETPLVALVEALEAERSSPSGVGCPRRRRLCAEEGVPPIEGVIQRGRAARPFLARLAFTVPARSALPPLQQYARLECNGERRLVGYVEASRGCAHLCTHCPIPPVYGGRFFVIPREVVLEDIRRQVAAGAAHITFGDPDFLNGPGHSMKLVQAMHAEFPSLTFDFTAKIEHILERRALFPELAELGCLFIVSAVESLSETVLAILEKHHTRGDVVEALAIVREAGIALRPTWVPFTPWTSLDDYLEIFDFIEAYNLIDHVDPVQYTIRLLVPPGSYLAHRPAMQPYLRPLDQAAFSFRWTHPDFRMDPLQQAVSALVEQDARAEVDPAITFFRVWALAASVAGLEARHGVEERCRGRGAPPPDRGRAPRLSEPWFC